MSDRLRERWTPERGGHRPLSRRGLLTLSAPLALGLATGATLLPRPAAAGVGWCRVDPHLAIGGRETNIFVERIEGEPITTTGPIQLIVTVPVGVSTAVLAADDGFGYGYDISFEESNSLNASANRIYIELAAFVPGPDKKMQVRLVSDPLDPAYTPQTRRSTTNMWMYLNSQV